jgi:hypothetical protein
MQGIKGFRLSEVLLCEEAFTKRGHAEIDKGMLKRLAAIAAATRVLGWG